MSADVREHGAELSLVRRMASVMPPLKCQMQFHHKNIEKRDLNRRDAEMCREKDSLPPSHGRLRTEAKRIQSDIASIAQIFVFERSNIQTLGGGKV